jgi:hypothetical protein
MYGSEGTKEWFDSGWDGGGGICRHQGAHKGHDVPAASYNWPAAPIHKSLDPSHFLGHGQESYHLHGRINVDDNRLIFKQ